VDAGAVDEKPERRLLAGPLHESLRQTRLGEIAADELPGPAQGVSYLPPALLVPARRENPPACLRERERSGAPDPARRSGDDGRASQRAVTPKTPKPRPAFAATSSWTTCTSIFVRSARCQAR
jgi:hypothetical protein